MIVTVRRKMHRWRKKTISSVCLTESEELPNASRKNGIKKEIPTVKPMNLSREKLSTRRYRRLSSAAKKSRLPRRPTRRDVAEVDRPELRRSLENVNRMTKFQA